MKILMQNQGHQIVPNKILIENEQQNARTQVNTEAKPTSDDMHAYEIEFAPKTIKNSFHRRKSCEHTQQDKTS